MTIRFAPWFFLGALLLALAGCGGGSGAVPDQALAAQGAAIQHAADTNSPSAQTAALPAPLATLMAPADTIEVLGLVKFSERRISRTLWEYAFRITARNNGLAADGITLQLQAAGNGTSIIDGTVAIASLGAGATTTAEDTVLVRHDRSVAFDTAALRWHAEVQAVSSRVDVDPQLPAAARQALTGFVSPEGEAAPGQSIRMSAQAVGSIAVGTSHDGRMLVAAALWQPETRFGAESTALVLIQHAMGVRGMLLDPATLNQTARQSGSFGALVDALQLGLTRGQAVADNLTVVPLLITVASDAATALAAASARTSGTASVGGKTALALAQPRVHGSLPFRLESLAIGPTFLSLQIDQNRNAPGMPMVLANALPAFFDIDLEDTAGTTLAPRVQMPMHRLDGASLALLALWGNGEERELAVSGQRHFNLRVSQSTASKARTWRVLWTEALAMFIGKRLADADCGLALVAPGIERLISQTVSDVQSRPTLDLLSDAKFVADLVAVVPEKCVRFVKLSERVLAANANLYVRWFATPLQVFSVASLTAEFSLAGALFLLDTDRRFGVCRNADGLIVNCVSRFEFNPELAYAAPNSRFYPERDLVAFDIDNRQTGIPAALDYAAQPSASISYSLGQWSTSAAPGIGTFTVRDPEAPAFGAGRVQVVLPRLQPTAITLPRSVPYPLQLVDPQSGVPLRWASFTIWSIDRPNEAALGDVPAWLPFIRPDADLNKLFQAYGTGRFRVTATNPFSNWTSSTDILVVPDVEVSGTLSGRAPFVWSTGNCRGSYGFDGIWKVVHSTDGSRFEYDLSEILRSNCFDQTIRYYDGFTLTATPSADPTKVRMTGSKTYPFSQGGRLILSAEVLLEGNSLTGTFRWDHLNSCCNNPARSNGGAALEPSGS